VTTRQKPPVRLLEYKMLEFLSYASSNPPQTAPGGVCVIGVNAPTGAAGFMGVE
jgi:hypothetical protein